MPDLFYCIVQALPRRLCNRTSRPGQPVHKHSSKAAGAFCTARGYVAASFAASSQEPFPTSSGGAAVLTACVQHKRDVVFRPAVNTLGDRTLCQCCRLLSGCCR